MGGVMEYQNHSNFVGSKKLFKIYELLSRQCNKLYGCKYADARTLSGVNAVMTLLMSLFSAGDTILISSEECGGHGSMPKICQRLGIKTIEMPYNYDLYDFDYCQINEILNSQKIEGILICLSDIIIMPQLNRINLPEDCVLIFDATQILGLIATKSIENPLKWFNNDQKFILMGATHKTLPGPTCGLIMTNNLKLAQQFDTLINPDYLRNSQLHHIFSLILTLMELEIYGEKYCNAVINNANILAQGFPGEETEVEELLDYVEGTYGKVLHNAADKENILWQIEDLHLDPGNRVYELNGFSGSPVWNMEDNEKSIVGLFTNGVGRTIYRGKVHAVKIEAIKSIMKIFFQIRMETRILGIPEKDVAPERENSTCFSEEEETEISNVYDEWLVGQTEKVRAYIDDVKFQSAIDTAKSAINDGRFVKCSKIVASKHMKHLLYCYEGCLLYEEYGELEKEMQRRSFLEGHDPLRWITLNFGKRNFKETIAFTEELLKKEEIEENVKIIAEVYASISRAYVENVPAEETIGKFLDEKECLIIRINDMGTEALVYQMLGYAYGEHYKQYVKAVRCLNRAYRLEQDHAVLETLGCAYYFLAIKDALREDDTVDIEKMDRVSLYKARECFLILLDKADELYLAAMMKREGGVIYNTFYFEQDNYRILTLYPILMKNLPDDDAKMRRDFEMKYARTVCQSGSINLTQFRALTAKDKTLLFVLAEEINMLHILDFKSHARLKSIPNLDKRLYAVIENTERKLSEIDEKEQISVISMLLNLYRWGKYLFGWNVISRMKEHMKYIKSTKNQKMITTFDNFIYECSHESEEAEKRYIRSWEENPSFELWQEILQFYKRNNMLDKADEMFEKLFTEHKEYVESEPEYIYRVYILYILDYQRDLKKALQFYTMHKDEMKDGDIREFWESELMMCTNSFNNPKQFEEERKLLVEQGLMPEEEFHRISLVAYMCNLDSDNAWKHFSKKNPLFGKFGEEGEDIPALTNEGAQFLIWQRKYPPHMEMKWRAINIQRANEARKLFEREEWNISPESIAKKLKYEIQRSIAIDVWGLYLLAVVEKLEILEKFDCLYVTHFSVCRMLDEITHFKNENIEVILAYLESADHVKLQSPKFETQLQIRENAEYYEPCSTIAMAIEAEVPAVIGEPMLGRDIIDGFKNYIVRPGGIERMMES